MVTALLLHNQGSPEFHKAQRNFVESMAAYSIVCYLLQIKDRHNGNIMLDDTGHVVHIDFGFMLSNSPGGVNFESAPFKLTRELLEVMDSNSEGKASELFDYFKVREYGVGITYITCLSIGADDSGLFGVPQARRPHPAAGGDDVQQRVPLLQGGATSGAGAAPTLPPQPDRRAVCGDGAWADF